MSTPGDSAPVSGPGEAGSGSTSGSGPTARPVAGPVVVVGSGRVGRTLTGLLTRSGHAVRLLGRSDDVTAEVAGAGTAVLAVGDDSLPGLVGELGAAGAFRPGQLVVHLSGAVGTGVLDPAAGAGALTAAAHPVLPFTGDVDTDQPALATAAVGLTADPAAQPAARALLSALGVRSDRVVTLAEGDRAAWHAAVCVAANHAFAAVVDGAQRLSRLRVDDPGAVLAPVTRAAVELALARGPAGHTGPVARGDAGTVAAHLAVPAPRDSLDAYRAAATLLAGQVAGAGGADGRPMRVVRTRGELAAALAVTARPRGLVMTLGALHEGHLRHVARAREAVGPAGTVVLSVFVNPLQFGPGEDLDAYPRTLEADLAAARAAGVDVVFAPTVDAVYPDGDPELRPDPGPLGDQLEGAARPGHFAGVLTVVSRVMRLVSPDVATFGEKDYQQLALVRRMVRDLGPDVEIVPVPTVREADGLAMSSRNTRLSAADRARAAAVPAALRAGTVAAADGADAALGAVRAVLADAGLEPASSELRAPDLGPAPATGPARLLLAVRVGDVRLLDNAAVRLGPDDPAAVPDDPAAAQDDPAAAQDRSEP